MGGVRLQRKRRTTYGFGLGDCAGDEVVHHSSLIESHFMFGWVHIHIDFIQRQGKVKEIAGKISIGESFGECGIDGMRDQAIFHQSSIDIKKLAIGLPSNTVRGRDPAVNSVASSSDRNGLRVLSKAFSPEGFDTSEGILGW